MSENPLPSQEFHFFDPERQDVRVVVIHPPKRRYWLHALLFLLTLLSTLCIGARLQYNFNHGLPAFKLMRTFFPGAGSWLTGTGCCWDCLSRYACWGLLPSTNSLFP